MFGLTPAHLVIILVIALVVIGPGKLPEVGGAIGKSIREFQKAAGQLQEPTQTTQAAPPVQPMQPLPPTAPVQPMPPAQSYYAAQPAYGAPQQPQYGAPVYPQQPPQYGAPAYPVQPQYAAPVYPMNTAQPIAMDPAATAPIAPAAPLTTEFPPAGPRVD